MKGGLRVSPSRAKKRDSRTIRNGIRSSHEISDSECQNGVFATKYVPDRPAAAPRSPSTDRLLPLVSSSPVCVCSFFRVEPQKNFLLAAQFCSPCLFLRGVCIERVQKAKDLSSREKGTAASHHSFFRVEFDRLDDPRSAESRGERFRNRRSRFYKRRIIFNAIK